MKYQELELRAMALSLEERDAGLRSLVNDPRFPCLLRLVRDELEVVQSSACGPQVSSSHGMLAHAAGAEYLARELLAKVNGYSQMPKSKLAKKPPAD